MPDSEIILYQSEDGQMKVEVRMEGETVWLTLNQLAELFQRDKSVISRHIKTIYEEGELLSEGTVAKNATVQIEGGREGTRDIDYYNLDIIISVGYRVNSHRGTQFRIWATNRLREYIIKGFTLDDERLKRVGQMNYFDELLPVFGTSAVRKKCFTKQLADDRAEKEYEKFKAQQQAIERDESLNKLETDLKKIETGKKKNES